MTYVKYGTIAKDPHREKAIFMRGDQTGESHHYICDCEGCKDSAVPIQTLFAEERIELPDRMTLQEYQLWAESEDGKEFIKNVLQPKMAEWGYEDA